MDRRSGSNNRFHVRRHECNRSRVFDGRGLEFECLRKYQRHKSTSVHSNQLVRHVFVPGARNGKAEVDEYCCSDEPTGRLDRHFVFADEHDNGLDEEGLRKVEAAVKESRDDAGSELPLVSEEGGFQETGLATIASCNC